MKKILGSILAFSLLAYPLIELLASPMNPPQPGGTLPPFSLPVPEDPSLKEYLGLSGKGLFKISEIKTKILIIEIFSMYCPQCHKEAPRINELYNLIEKDTELKGKIKIIGIGAGNTPFEVETFKKTYKIPFPLFSDRDYTLHKLFGEVRTPYFIVVKFNEDGTHKIVHAQLGGYPGAEAFLELVLKTSGSNQ